MNRRILSAPAIFDGETLLHHHVLVIEGDRIADLLPRAQAPAPTDLLDGILVPAFLDLQVNGGAGHQIGPDTDLTALRLVCDTHRRLGCAGILPTLITDTPETTARVIDIAIKAKQTQIEGFLGLHLEGPHLDPRRKGAHAAHLIHPMQDSDMHRLCDAARQLPALMVTLAPEAATPAQIATLTRAGVIVSLGHSDCSFETATRAFKAGARAATHLFNAMSPLTSRAPGLTGAVLAGTAAASVIADGVHVHPASLRVALAARPKGLFLVSDAMAFAGTELTEITLNNRRILRRDGRLTLEDGTLAGADLTLAGAIHTLITQADTPPAHALHMASSLPAQIIGRSADLGCLAPGRRAEIVRLTPEWKLGGIWSGTGWLIPP
jgi:N-acetylglucosamine-6-phosphate deacetylase